MKKVLVFSFFLVFVKCEFSFGQIGLNFSTGINYSNSKFENLEVISPKARTGYFFGVAPNYQMSKIVQFQIDFQYSLKGYKTGNQNNYIPFEYRFSYVDIIPEFEFYLFKYLALGIGLNYGIKLNEQIRIEGSDWSTSGDFETIKLTDFGLTGKLKANFKYLFVIVRYNVGIKGISNLVFTDVDGHEIENTKQSNRNLQIGLGYKLNFKKD